MQCATSSRFQSSQIGNTSVTQILRQIVSADTTDTVVVSDTTTDSAAQTKRYQWHACFATTKAFFPKLALKISKRTAEIAAG